MNEEQTLVDEATKGMRDAIANALDQVIAAAAAEPGSPRVALMRDQLADTYAQELVGAVQRALRAQAAGFLVEFNLLPEGSDATH